jgi:hypothetical protein
MRQLSGVLYAFMIIFFAALPAKRLSAQRLLDKKLSIAITHRSLQQALTDIGHKGDFYFSYNSHVIPGDSAVSITVEQKTVKEILQLLLGYDYEYRENGNYIIIRKYPGGGKTFMISGYVINKKTGEKIPNASVYEHRQLVSTLTDKEGYFQMRLHNRLPDVLIGVSKINFNDTLYRLRSGYDQTLAFTLSPIRTIMLQPVTVTPYSQIEGTWFGKFFISSRQKIRDINLSRFFVKQPFQYAVWPGAGTHGKLSAQVVNKFSLNIFGGYSAGVNGFELGGLFNIDKNDVQYTQIAGLFNTVGGKTTGAQVAGLHNSVLDSVKGVQIAGISNRVRQNMTGVQIAGIVNKAKSAEGIQLAGISNITPREVNGMQVAGIFNYTRNLKGMQIGLVNISDTSSGYSIGLLNVIRHNGYYKLSLFWNEAMDMNLAIKTGNKKLYNILLAGADLGKDQKTFAVGYGIGRAFTFSHTLSMTTELTEQNIFIGYKNDVPVLVRLQPALQVHLSKRLSLFAGPAFSVYLAGSSQPSSGFKDRIPPDHHFTLWNSAMAWFGGQIGITFL